MVRRKLILGGWVGISVLLTLAIIVTYARFSFRSTFFMSLAVGVAFLVRISIAIVNTIAIMISRRHRVMLAGLLLLSLSSAQAGNYIGMVARDWDFWHHRRMAYEELLARISNGEFGKLELNATIDLVPPQVSTSLALFVRARRINAEAMQADFGWDWIAPGHATIYYYSGDGDAALGSPWTRGSWRVLSENWAESAE